MKFKIHMNISAMDSFDNKRTKHVNEKRKEKKNESAEDRYKEVSTTQ